MTDKRSQPRVYGEVKKKYQIMLTPSASDQLDSLAELLGATRSDVAERVIRALYNTGDEALIRAFLARGEGDRNV